MIHLVGMLSFEIVWYSLEIGVEWIESGLWREGVEVGVWK